jgi:hypothetical protein
VRRFAILLAAVTLTAGSMVVSPQAPARAAAVRSPQAALSLPDYDVRARALGARALLGETADRAASKRGSGSRFPGGAAVRWSALTGGPRTIVPATGALTEPATGTPAEIAERFVRDNADLYGLDEADLAGLTLAREYASADLGVTHLTFVQEIDGRRLFGADLRIAVDSHNRVVWAGGEVVPGASALSKRSGWRLDAVEGAVAAAASIGAAAEPHVVASKGGAASETVVELGAAFVEPAVARQTLFPLAAGSVRPAWTVLLAERGPGNLYVVTVDAEKGTLLARHNLTRYAGGPTDARFRVFAEDSPQPHLPSVANNPTSVERVLVGLPTGTLAVSPEGWVGSQAVTSGNNVRAQEDRDRNNSGGQMAQGTTDFVFDPALDFPIRTSLPNTEAAIVNLFYWNNVIHDYLYRLGFDEAAGNFQAANFTGQGRGGDAVIADAQDGAGTNNANFSTPPDGGAPRMQMFLWDGGFDGSFDQTIIIHEYVHGLSTRLVGGPDYGFGLTGQQSGGMGEGWSDWYALTMLSQPGDALDAPYAVGAYATRDFNAGVRHFPYSTRMQTNPLTYSDIDPATGDEFGEPSEVHAVGEVWCATLWEIRANFIEAYGFEEGKALVERLVTDGMKFTSVNPSFVDGRDGILVADQVRTGGANQCLIWRGFAKRGVGYGAFALDGTSTSVKESFELPPWCETEGRPSLDSSSYDEDATSLTVSVGDADLAGQSTASVVLTSTSGDSESVALDAVENIPGLFERNMPIQRGGATAGDGTLDVRIGDTITVDYGGATTTARVVRRVSLFEDRLESGTTNWKAGKFQLTTEAAASPTHSWTDSPGAQYADETLYRLQLKPKFDLRGGVGSRLFFRHKYDTEAGYDLCIVEARAKGKDWTILAVFSGRQAQFQPVTLDMSEFDGRAGVKIRFSLVTDQLVHEDGWHIDDVEVQTGRTE